MGKTNPSRPRTVSTDDVLNTAVSHHAAGRLADAERIYRDILAQQPNHPVALYFLGRIAASRAFIAAELDTGLIERNRAELLPHEAISDEVLAAAAFAELLEEQRGASERAAASGAVAAQRCRDGSCCASTSAQSRASAAGSILTPSPAAARASR